MPFRYGSNANINGLSVKMTASKQAKEAGLKSLLQVSQIVKKSPQTLDNWSKQSPELFEVVLLGCAQKIAKKNEEE